ncbi:MAG: FmdB family transcriptional regulator [Opitutus sp.]|nr:FmdB family transcriptional regulator [Opitutus sp.]
MPTYEYVCAKCGHEMEAFQSMKDAPLKKCPCCGKTGLKRRVGGGAGLIFKGSGFYITDYKKKPAGKSEGAKTESKPAEKSAK